MITYSVEDEFIRIKIEQEVYHVKTLQELQLILTDLIDLERRWGKEKEAKKNGQ